MYAPYCAEYVPVWTSTSCTVSTIGCVGDVVIRLFMMLMPSSDMLFWISRVPAPMKSWPGGTPCVPLVPGRTPGVVVASIRALRPLSGRSAICLVVTVAEIVASSVLMTGADASTVIDS